MTLEDAKLTVKTKGQPYKMQKYIYIYILVLSFLSLIFTISCPLKLSKTVIVEVRLDGLNLKSLKLKQGDGLKLKVSLENIVYSRPMVAI